MKKKLAEAEKATKKAEQERYDIGVVETKKNLRADVSGVCRSYYLQVWNETLNQTRVNTSSTLRKVKNVYYPPAIQASGPSSSKAKTAPKDPDFSKDVSASALPSITSPPKEVKQVGATEKEKETAKEVASKATKLPPVPKTPPR